MMVDNLMHQTSFAIEDQKRIPDSLARIFFWLVAIAVPLCLAVSLLAYPAGQITFHFDEGGAVTASSTLMLAMSAAFAFIVYLIRFDKGLAVRITWLLFTAGFAFLALDEQIELHEKLGGEIERVVQAARFGLPDTNDLIVIAYGIVAVPVFLLALPELARWPGVTRLFLIAVPFYVAHTAIDSIDIEQDPRWFIAEETAKFICVAFMFAAMLKLVIAVINASMSTEKCNARSDFLP